jgi:hypothetical protein
MVISEVKDPGQALLERDVQGAPCVHGFPFSEVVSTIASVESIFSIRCSDRSFQQP